MPALTSVKPQYHASTSPQRLSHKRKAESDVKVAGLDAKRAKVSFNSDVEIKIMDEVGERTPSLVAEEIRRAIQKRQAGDGEEYANLIQMLSEPTDSEDAPTDAVLGKHLVGLTNNVSLLNKSCSDLVHAAISTEWLARDDTIATAYTRFIGNLVSSQAGYVHNVLKLLVDNFAHISTSAGRTASQVEFDRSICQNRLHAALKYILALVPSASASLAAVITSSFPFATDTKKAHIEYVRNLLRLSQYAPELTAEILDLITERLIKIDVQVQIDVEDFEEDIGEMLVEGELGQDIRRAQAIDEEGDDDDRSDVESVFSDDSIDEEEQRMKDLQSSVEKMDSILDILFAHLSPSLHQKQASIEASSLFNILLSQFRKTVLPTYRSRHTQFLIFHFAQTSPARATQFVDACLQILEDRSRSSVMRVSAAAYIASFTSRAKHITSECVMYTFDRLTAYLQALQKQHAPLCTGPDLRRYAPYYATYQALMYIFCFRWRDMQQDEDSFSTTSTATPDPDEFDPHSIRWLPGIKSVFENAARSTLNPLKVCAPEVVEEFTRTGYALRFIYLHHIVEANKRLRLSNSRASVSSMRQTSLTNLQGDRINQLDAYFPFDPYRLPGSKKWVENDYVEWQGLPGLGTEDDASMQMVDHDSSDAGVGEDVDDGMVDADSDDGTETPDEA